MLPAAARLHRRAEFTSTVRGGRRAARGGLVVHLAAGPADSPARAGFVVARSVGGAVTRNLVTRRLRHLVRDRLSGLPGGSRVVVRALPAAAGRGFADLGRDLDGALRRLSRGTR